MARSIVAGIVDRGGGVRVVVTAQDNIHYHVGEGERLYVVPDFFVEQPLPYEKYAHVIETALEYVKSHGV